MPRGITEKDVFTACDALLLAGERPTIERVRQKIGRGSPNTVSPMLDAWFKGLGRRLQDPGAFAAPPDVPDPVFQAAQHFWEVAQASARADLEAQVTDRLAPMQAEVDRAKHAVATAISERDAAESRAQEALRQVSGVTARLDADRTAHAATATHLENARRHADDLEARLKTAEAEARNLAERSRAEVHAAQERASGSERRAALEIENERLARGKADKRAEGLEKRVESLQVTSAKQVEELVKTRSELEHERASSERLRQLNEEAIQKRLALDASLVEAKLAIGRAEAEAKATQSAMEQLLPLVAEGRVSKGLGKKKLSTKGTAS